jgi:NAD(P)-dependent dehydrogenase (short-subunit alcohol dehydrogenase family)
LPSRIKVVHERKEGDAKGLKWSVSKEDAEVHAANRAGMPEGVADAVEYLMGAGFVNGHSLVVEGEE